MSAKSIFALLLVLIMSLHFFGCSDKENKTVSSDGITEISFYAGFRSEKKLGIGDVDSGHFKVSADDDFLLDDIKFVSTDPSVASFEYDKTVLTNYVYYKITGLSAGETVIYVSTSDGRIKSEEIKIFVADKETEKVPETEEDTGNDPNVEQTYILNTSSKKYHLEGCSSADKIKESNKDTFFGTSKKLEAMGYIACRNCH